MNRKELTQLFRRKTRIKLDVGCGEHCQVGWIGMDRRKCKGVDIVHDVQVFPWPLPNSCMYQILMSHLYEHIEPKYRIDLINECWRILRPDGQLILTAPYATSHGAFQDPTHYPCPNESSFTYFDPGHMSGLYNVYKPKPWKLVTNTYQMNGNLEVLMEPIKS